MKTENKADSYTGRHQTLFYYAMTLLLLFSMGLLLPVTGKAETTLQQLQHLEAHKLDPTLRVVPVRHKKRMVRKESASPRKKMVVELVLFMQGHCIHCQRFDPVLHAFSEHRNLPVFAYTLDGKGAAPYADAVTAPNSVIQTFFGQRYPVATPTLFLVKMDRPDNLQAYPVLQGEATYQQLVLRVDKVMTLVKGGSNGQ